MDDGRAASEEELLLLSVKRMAELLLWRSHSTFCVDAAGGPTQTPREGGAPLPQASRAVVQDGERKITREEIL
jgi:hypothetical protein